MEQAFLSRKEYTEYSSGFVFTSAPCPKGYINSFHSVGRRWDALLQSCLTLENVVEQAFLSRKEYTEYSSGFVFTSAPCPKGYINSFHSVGRRWDALLQSCLTLKIVVEHIWGIPQSTDYSSGFVFTSGLPSQRLHTFFLFSWEEVGCSLYNHV